MVDRQSGMKCISDIIFLYRSKRPPQSYTLIGDINGLLMCVKEGNIPPFRAPPHPPMPQSGMYPNPATGQLQSPQSPNPTSDYSTLNVHSKKNDEKEILDGVPFQINPKYLPAMNKQPGARTLDGLETFRILSPFEIDQYFQYDFRAEHAALSLVLPSSWVTGESVHIDRDVKTHCTFAPVVIALLLHRFNTLLFVLLSIGGFFLTKIKKAKKI